MHADRRRCRPRAALVLVGCVGLAACGGGGSSAPPPPPPNQAPSADAGPDAIVDEGGAYTLDGSASSDGDGTIAAYVWEQMAGPDVVLEDLGALRARFDAPQVSADTTLSFALTVTDDDGAADTDVVSITVEQVGFSISGTVSAAQGTVVDGDVNDPNAALVPNSTPQSAQRIPNPITVGGYVNEAGAGPDGALRASGDVSDYYRVDLIEGQTITLLVGDTAAGDPDLYLWDATGETIVDVSELVGEVESLVVPASGEYLVEAYAFSGASTYVLIIGNTPIAAAAGARLSDDFVAGEVVMRYAPAQASGGQAAKTSAVASLGLDAVAGAPDRAMLMRLAPGHGRAALRADGGANRAAARAAAFASDELRAKHETLVALKRLRRDPSVAYAEPNYIRRPMAVPNDEHYALQWHYPLIGLPAAWNTTTGEPSVIVAVLDTGVLLDHPDLRDKVDPGFDFISSPAIGGDGDGIDADPDDVGDGGEGQASSFHGTHVAGTIGAASNNGEGVAGVAWGARIMPLRVLGIGGGTDHDIVQAVRYASGLENDSGQLAGPVDVINLSLGGVGPCTATYRNVFDLARAAGVTIVVAAGNSNVDAASMSPANCPNVITVSAVGMDKRRAPYSNFGAAIDVAAPGGNMSQDFDGDGYADGILSALGQDAGGGVAFGYSFYQGTSMASPHVAGVVALMKSVNPDLTPDDIDDMLAAGLLTDDIGAAGDFGAGLINAQKAVAAALEALGAPPVEDPTLDVTPRSLNFGTGATTAELTVRNLGGGALQAQPPQATQPWLTVEPGPNVSAANLGVYSIDVDRAGLPDGVYADTLAVQSDAGTIEVPVIMQVAGSGIESDAGFLYILLVDFETGDVVDAVGAVGAGGDYDFAFTDVPDGTYWIAAGSDADNDNFICDAGEVCGAYLTRARPETIVLDGDRAELDFTAGYQVAIPSQTAAADAPPAPGLPLPARIAAKQVER